MVNSKDTGKKNISVDLLISQINKEKDELKTRLCDSLSKLLDYAFDIEIEKGYCPTLTGPFGQKQDSDESTPLKMSYIAMRGKIYLIAFDPDSDTIDPGRSYKKEVSKTEFLEWAKQSLIRVLDIYDRLTEYIKAPSVKLGAPEDSFSQLGIL